RRQLSWLKDNGYVVQESRGHNVGDVSLASVYTLAMPDLPLTTERKPTAQFRAPTAQSEQTYRSFGADLPLTTKRLSDPASDPFTSDPSTSNPPCEPDEFELALTRNRESRIDQPAAEPVAEEETYCQYCEDSAVNVCGLHFHDRKHRYRERQKTVQPEPDSRP